MADENTNKNPFDFTIELPPEKGKACHMQVDEDLHRWLNEQRVSQKTTFRKLANMLLCKGIQEFIKVKKIPSKVRDRSN